MLTIGLFPVNMSTSQPVQSADHGTDDARLLQGYFKHGDHDAMEEFLLRHADAAFHCALGCSGNSADAEDICQAAFLQVLLNGDRICDQANFNPRGWLMTIIINTYRKKLRQDASRRQRNEESIRLREQSFAPDDEKAELVSVAIRALQSLPENYRLPIWLHYMGGMSVSEVAFVLTLPENTARGQIKRGIEQLRQSLAGFTTGAVAIPELLSSAALPSTPTALTASFKALIASAAAKTAGAATGTASTVVQGSFITASSKIAVTSALLLTVTTVVTIAFHAGGGYNGTKADGAPAPSLAQAADRSQVIDKSLAAILDKKIDVVYRRDYLPEVLDDLDKRVGLRSVFPKPVGQMFLFSLEEKQITVKQVLEKLALEGRLEVEYHGDEVAFWKKADDKFLAELEKKLKEGNVEARCEAVYDLAQLGDKRIYPFIFRGLSDKQEAVASEAIRVLDGHAATVRYGTNVQPLFEILSKPLSVPKMAAYKNELMTLLSYSRDPRAFESLIALLKDMDASVRSNAALAVVNTRDPRAFESLIALLKDTDANVRSNAAYALANTRDPRVVEPLIALLKDTDTNVRSSAAYALGKTRDPRAFEPLIALVKDTDVKVQHSAAPALSYTRDPRAFESLIALLKDTDASVRSGAAVALGNTRDPRAFESLIALLKDTDASVRSGAAVALGNTRDPRAFESLIALLKDTDASLRSGAAAALGNSRDPRVVEPLIALLKDTDARVRSNAAYALRNTRDPRAFESLIALLKDTDGSVRFGAAAALVNTRDPRVVEPLITLLKDRNANVRSNAAYALCNTRDPRAFESLIALLKDTDGSVRSYAVFALSINLLENAQGKTALDEYKKVESERKAAVKSQPVKPSAPPLSGDF